MRLIKYLDESVIEEKTLTNEEMQDLIGQIQEASFGSGKAQSLIPKISSLLAKRTRMSVGISTLPSAYQNSIGKFNGYFGFYDNDKALRINFLLSGSDKIYSIDFYDDAEDLTPAITVSLDGYNIVQVINIIVDIMTGDFADYADELMEGSTKKNRKLSERLKLTTMMEKYLQGHQNVMDDLKSGRANYDDIADEFLVFIKDEYGSLRKGITAGAIQIVCEKVLSDLGISSNVGTVSVDAGVPDSSLIADPVVAALFDQAMHPKPAQIMEDMADVVRAIGQGNKFYTGALIFGKAGSGKTETVRNVLREEGADFTTVSTPVGGYTGFMWILYSHKKDEIIVFDDNDSIFDDEKTINLLKKALEREPVRTFNVLSDIKVRGSGKADDANVIPEGSFDFTTKIIFMSNKSTMDSAIVSRLAGAVFEINFTNAEMFELIEENIDNIYAEYEEFDATIRNEVLEFIRLILPASKDIDFRRFQAVLTIRLAAKDAGQSGDLWKRRSIRVLNTAPKAKRT